MKSLRQLSLVVLLSIVATVAYAQTADTCQPVVPKRSTLNAGTKIKPLYCSSESLVDQITDAATNGGYDLSVALTYALNGDSEDAATWINQAITDYAPILAQSSIPPTGAKKDGR